MIKRTRLQLTIRNAAVLSVILIALTLSVFFVMKDMLYSQIDRSLTGVSVSLAPESAMAVPAMTTKPAIYQVGQMDRPVFQLFWTMDNVPIESPGTGMFRELELGKLRPDRLGADPETVKVGDQYYRAFNSLGPNMTLVYTVNGERYSIEAKQQVLTNISAEVGMLHRLQNILLFGGLVGLVVAVAAGYYLANRALIPIRVSLEKQQQFVSDASHELRTPLSVIQAHAEVLLRHPDHTIEQDSEHVATVLQETRRMNKLIRGLLTLARADSNQAELELQTFSLDDTVRRVVGNMRMLAEGKSIIIYDSIEDELQIRADEGRMQQLLTSLLDNAIRYTHEGGQIRVSCRKLANAIQLEVEDTGVGIAPEHLPRIFDRFYRGDASRSRQDGGAGLGLAIVHWIVERHGGKIRVDSKPGVGTRFTVSLPSAGLS